MRRIGTTRIALTVLGVLALAGCATMQDLDLGDVIGGEAPLDEATVIRGLKQALSVGTERTVDQVGALDGYLGDELLRIALPEELQDVAGTLRQVGLGARVDELEVAMNRAAELVYRGLLEQGHQRDLIDIMQTREELYAHLGYHDFEQKLDELFARRKEDPRLAQSLDAICTSHDPVAAAGAGSLEVGGTASGEAVSLSRARILLALEETGGNRAAAARLLGVARATLYRRLAKLGLD